jgi:hypothetical protein
LNTKTIRPAKIHRQLVDVHGKNVMYEGDVPKWCHSFIGGDMCTTRRDLDARLSALRQYTTMHCLKTTELLKKFGCEYLDHSPHSLDLTPFNFHLSQKWNSFYAAK